MAKINHLNTSQAEMVPLIRYELGRRMLTAADVARQGEFDDRAVRDYLKLRSRSKIGFHARIVEWYNNLPALPDAPNAPGNRFDTEGFADLVAERVVRKLANALRPK